MIGTGWYFKSAFENFMEKLKESLSAWWLVVENKVAGDDHKLERAPERVATGNKYVKKYHPPPIPSPQAPQMVT